MHQLFFDQAARILTEAAPYFQTANDLPREGQVVCLREYRLIRRRPLTIDYFPESP